MLEFNVIHVSKSGSYKDGREIPVKLFVMENISTAKDHYRVYTGWNSHYSDVIMSEVASQITGVSIVYSSIFLGTDKKNTSKLCVSGLCAGNSPITDEFSAQRASNV